jgi:hypothetical protein
MQQRPEATGFRSLPRAGGGEMTFRIPLLRKIPALLTVGALIATLLAMTPVSAETAHGATTGTTYYVDAEAGQDLADGRSPEQAWRTLDRVNATTFQPGDAVLLRAGKTWNGQLWPKGSGTAEAPITVGKYGDGLKPALRGNGQVDDVVRLFNQSHWVLRDLDVSNQRTGGATEAANLADLRGVHISGDNSTTLSGLSIIGVDVHDVTGEVNWISGSTANNAPGINFGTGWDGSKKTGGIVFDTTVPDIHNPPSTPTILNDILVEGSTVVNTSFAGIVVKQYTGDGRDANGNIIATPTGWGTRVNATDPKFVPHTNVTIRNNYIRQDGTSYGCNGMYLTNIRGGLVEHNVVHRAGTSGIETYYADDVTIQYNEVYETQQKAGGADSNGIDPDKGTTKQLIQYNYLHDNGDGVLICQFVFGDAVIRNNVIVDNKRYPIYLHSDRAAKAQVYNNTIVNRVSNYLIYGYGSSLAATYDIRNNIIHSTKPFATLTTSSTIDYENNLYSGAQLTVPDTDTAALVGDAMFTNTAATGPYGTAQTGPQLATANGFSVQSGSKAVNTSAQLEPSAATDYAGAPRPVGAPDLGAFEYATPAGAATETASGFVRDQGGRPISGAAVSATVGGSTRTATTDATGWFRVTGVPLGTATVTAARAGYEGAPATVTIGTGTSAFVPLALNSTSNEGTVSGSVLNVAGAPLHDARISVRAATGNVVATGTSAADGRYTVTLPVGDGYTVAAEAADLRTATTTGISVAPATNAAVPSLLLQPAEPATIFSDDVQSRTPGRFSSVDGYTASHSGGSVDVADVDATRAFRLTRNTNSGSTSLHRNYSQPLKGLVTVEADIMRRDATDGTTNWFSVPYLYGTDGVRAVSVAFNKGDIVAYQGTESKNLMRYEQGRWYKLTLEVDTVNQRFDLLIDGKRVVDDATFRSPLVGGIARVEYYANSSNYGTIQVDNLRILQGTSRDKANTALTAVETDAGPALQDGTGWRLDVPAGTQSVRVAAKPVAAVVSAITINGAAAQPGVLSDPIALTEGTNTIQIVVTAENGTSQTHTLTVERAPLAADATLRSLAVESATLTPAFASDVQEYEVTTDPGATELVVTPTATGPASEISVNGQTVQSGSAATVAVSNGQVVPIRVSSADGTALVTYSLTVKVGPKVSAATAYEPNDQGWRASPATVTLTLNDGVEAGIEYRLGEGQWQPYDAPMVISQDGETVLSYRAVIGGQAVENSGGTETFRIDTTKPTVTLVGGPTGSYIFGHDPAAPACDADDAASGLASCTVTGGGSTVGEHTYTATATDNAGNVATAELKYTITPWILKGFVAPVDMDGVWNTAKAGSTIPLKFTMFDGDTEITDTAKVKGFTTAAVTCPGAGAPTDEIETVTTSPVGLVYQDGQFQQNWKSPKKAGTCLTVTVTAQDDSKLTANFILK